ncbi:EEF1A lysine methyltransferase 3-like isoform X1 [Scyliorhinus torazame]|uniref:EEF1A lysine methyltransferase 3-like isoform X1 n=1 Tax=Scyliorhinus torazame TaxID=75743 RepID=UPI003B5C1AB9
MEEPQENQQPSSSNEEQTPKASSKLETFFDFCGHNVCITREIKSTLGISAIIWEAGKVLCRYFENEQIDFSGKKVIELGAGTGLVGILAILLGGDVTLTDRPFVLDQLEYNVSKNITSDMMPRAKVSALMWGKDHEQFPTDYDYILGSDIIYRPSEFHFLIATLQHLSNQNTIIYFCSKMWVELGTVDFYEKVLPEYFDSEIVHTVPDQGINLYKITKKYPA